MWIYIGLIVAILVASLFFRSVYSDDHDKSERAILLFGIILIFLLLALKKDTVGIDISGYEDSYNASTQYSWLNTNWIYYESGYTILMQFFAMRGFSFQAFTAILYLILCSALYAFIRRYSSNVTLSLLMFICYQFLVFSISGLRQTLATAICLIAFVILDKVNIRRIIIAVLLTLLATTIHQSSLIFFIILFLRVKKTEYVRITNWILISIIALVSRQFIWSLISTYFREVDTSTSVSLGGNFLFMVGIAFFCWLTTNYGLSMGGRQINSDEVIIEPDSELCFLQQTMFLSVALTLLLSGNTLQRATMYSSIFLIPGLTRFIDLYDDDYRLALNVAMGAFMIILFYTQTLSINQLLLCPYLFFWQ